MWLLAAAAAAAAAAARERRRKRRSSAKSDCYLVYLLTPHILALADTHSHERFQYSHISCTRA